MPLYNPSADNSGWGAYMNGAGPQVLVANTKVVLVNNAASTIESQKPSDVTTFYNGTAITGRIGDGVLINIEMTFTPSSGLASYLTVSIDIGGAAGEIYPKEFTTAQGQDFAHQISYATGAYTLDTWAVNGGIVKVVSDGPGTITGVRYVIQRSHKAA
jgi:hypothetical protein